MTLSTPGKRPVHVLHIFHNLRVGAGGAEKSLHLLLTRMTDGRWDGKVSLALLDHGEDEENYGIGNAKRLPYKTLFLEAPWYLEAPFALRVALFVLRNKVDVIHAHMPGLHRLACLVGLVTGRPVIRSMRSNPARGAGKLNLMSRFWTRLTSMYVAIATDQVALIQSACRAPDQKITYIPNGIDISEIQRPDTDRAAKRKEFNVGDMDILLLTAGRLVSVKDFPTMIRAVALARKQCPQLRLLIAGEGDGQKELAVLIDELGVGDAVELLGMRSDIPELLAACDVFVASSLSEGCPRAIMEAMAAGKPVIGTNVPGIRFAVEHGKTGLLAPARSPEAMATAIVKMSEDVQLRMTFGSAALERAKAEFSLDEAVRLHIELYRRLAAARQ